MDDSDRNYGARENLWDQQWPSTRKETGEHPAEELDAVDELSPFPDMTGTTDVIESIRDAEPYSPPTDPPVLPGGPEGIHTATGFGQSIEEEFSELHPQGDEDVHDEAVLALRQDSLTSHYPLDVEVEQGIIYLRGSLPSNDDAEYATTLLSALPGVVDVVDGTTLEPTRAE